MSDKEYAVDPDQHPAILTDEALDTLARVTIWLCTIARLPEDHRDPAEGVPCECALCVSMDDAGEAFAKLREVRNRLGFDEMDAS